MRERATFDRLARGESPDYVELATRAFDPDVLTVGFARRLATYKRMQLLTRDLGRSLKLISGERPIQILLAGKAHPADDEAKQDQGPIGPPSPEQAQYVALEEVRESIVKKLGSSPAAKTPAKKADRDPNVVAAEQKLQSALGTKVAIVPGKKGGRLEVHYYSDEELERVYQLLMKVAP